MVMEITQVIDLFLHLDKYLAQAVQAWGVWIYALMFLIVFIETGVVVMPFLPGDSLLFVAGALAAVGGLNLPVLALTLSLAAILGDALNYSIGRWFGPRVFAWENSRWFNRQAFDRTHQFYEEYGPITIVLGRFLPFIRTFAPFVAGVAQMSYPKFAIYNVLGGILWAAGLTTLGYWIGDLPWVKTHFSWVALGMIVIPGLPAAYLVIKSLWRKLLNRSSNA